MQSIFEKNSCFMVREEFFFFSVNENYDIILQCCIFFARKNLKDFLFEIYLIKILQFIENTNFSKEFFLKLKKKRII